MAGKSLPTYREIVHSTDPAIRRVHDLVRRTFHSNKLIGIHEWRDSLREQEAGLWADIRWHLQIAEHLGRVVGVASGMYLGNINMGVVGYLAVSARARGLGVGSKLRARLRNELPPGCPEDRRESRSRRSSARSAGTIRGSAPWCATTGCSPSTSSTSSPGFARATSRSHSCCITRESHARSVGWPRPGSGPSSTPPGGGSTASRGRWRTPSFVGCSRTSRDAPSSARSRLATFHFRPDLPVPDRAGPKGLRRRHPCVTNSA